MGAKQEGVACSPFISPGFIYRLVSKNEDVSPNATHSRCIPAVNDMSGVSAMGRLDEATCSELKSVEGVLPKSQA